MKTFFAASNLSSALLLLLLSSCQSSQDLSSNISAKGAVAQPEPTTVSNSSSGTQGTLVTANPGTLNGPLLKAGAYCYKVDRPDLQGTAKLILTSGNQLSGDLKATISNKANAYYSTYVQQINGNLKGNLASLDVATTIEGDKQKTQESWTMESDRLATRTEVYLSAPCADHDKNTASQDPIAPSQVAKTPEAKIPEEPAAAERLSFAPGTTSARVKGGIVRGDRKIYLLTANQGQKMTLNVTSPEKNAVYNLVGPDGKLLQQELSQGSVTLPMSGDYQIILGGTRGNASYNLTVEIQ